MNNKIRILLFVLGLVFIMLLLRYISVDKKDPLGNNQKPTMNSTDNKVTKESLDILSIIPGGINMKSNYNDVIKAYGKPNEIKKITDKDLIKNKGYFVDLVYKDKEIIIYCYDEKSYNLEKNNEIAQIDFFGNGTSLNNKITIGDKYNDIYSKFKADNADSNFVNEIKKKLSTFNKDNIYENYTKLLSISTTDPNTLPVTMILLFNDNNVLERISYVNPTAD